MNIDELEKFTEALTVRVDELESQATDDYKFGLMMADKLAEVTAQRDELLVLLKSIYNDVVQGAIPNHGDEWYEHARTAIAEAEGEQ